MIFLLIFDFGGNLVDYIVDKRQNIIKILLPSNKYHKLFVDKWYLILY